MMESNGSFAEGYAIGRDSGGSGNNNGGFWGGDGWWALIIFAMIFGYGNNGWGNGGGNGVNSMLPYAVGMNGAVTRADLCEEFNANNLQNAVRGVTQGLCDGFYAVNTGMLNGFAGVNNAICSLGYEQANLANASNVALMQAQNALQTQIASCCCDNRVGQMEIANAVQNSSNTVAREVERGFCDVNYNMASQFCNLGNNITTQLTNMQTQNANNTRDIIDSQREGTRAILDYLCNEKISDLQSENQALRLAASQQAQNTYLVNALRPSPIPAYLSCNPWASNVPYGSCGYNGNCGCGCGF